MAKEEKKNPAATATAAKEKPAEEKPETVSLKDVAKQAGLEPREARAMLRKMNIRGEDQKRDRWVFTPADAPKVVAKLKAEVASKAAKAEEAKKAAEKA